MSGIKQLSDDPIEQAMLEADAKRSIEAGEEKLAKADKQRALTVHRDTELKRIAGDLPEDINALWMFTEHSLAQEAVSAIDAGRGLLKLKEKLNHGEFMEGLNIRGIPYRSARYKTAIACKFADRSEKLLKLGRTKLYAITELSDDELDTLEEGGSILDADLDALDRMTTRELKALIKKRDADIEVKDQILESKNKQIDDVATENTKLRGGVVEGEPNPKAQAIQSEKAQAIIPMMRLRNLALQMEADAMQGEEPSREEYFALHESAEQVRAELAQIMDALYNCGGAFQAVLGQATMADDIIEAES